jgi:hypothetical protein
MTGRKVTCGHSGGKVTCLRVPFIAPSAHKHGIADDDILHAFRNPIRNYDPGDEGLTMLVGPARDATLLEVGVVDSDDGPVIVHADIARQKFLPGKGNR